jgi:hypothetical protein
MIRNIVTGDITDPMINPGDIIDDDRPDAKNEAPKKPRAKRKTT